MELYWSTKGELRFQVHLKPNQQLKYLNEGSIHTKVCIKAIPEGVYKRLAKLTTVTEENQDKTLDEICPMPFKALSHAGLIIAKTKKIPTLKEEVLNYKTSKSNKDRIKAKKEDEKKRRRATFFCIGFSWEKSIHSVIKEIQRNFGITWLRVSMSYHRFTNLREIFQGDLSGKLLEGVVSETLAISSVNEFRSSWAAKSGSRGVLVL